MEDQVLIQEMANAAQEVTGQDIHELSPFQLAVIGGGCAEVCPY